MKANFKDLIYSEDDIIRFEDGIPGFDKNKEYVIVKDENYAPFEWLVCIDGTNLRFAMLNPMIVDPEYNPNITKSQITGLGLKIRKTFLCTALLQLHRIRPTLQSTLWDRYCLIQP